MFDLAREIVQTMRNNKLRTALTGLSVAWGIFMLIILLGMSRGVYNSFNSGFMAQASNSIQMWGGFTDRPYKGYKQGRYIEMNLDDVDALSDDSIPYVKNVMPIINGTSVTISTPRDYMTSFYQGVTPEYLKAQGREIVYGRFINQADIKEGRKVVVMAKRNINQLFSSVGML